MKKAEYSVIFCRVLGFRVLGFFISKVHKTTGLHWMLNIYEHMTRLTSGQVLWSGESPGIANTTYTSKRLISIFCSVYTRIAYTYTAMHHAYICSYVDVPIPMNVVPFTTKVYDFSCEMRTCSSAELMAISIFSRVLVPIFKVRYLPI